MSYVALKGEEIKILHDVLDLSEKQLKNLNEIKGFEDIESLEVIDLGHNQIEDLSCLNIKKEWIEKCSRLDCNIKEYWINWS